MNRITWLTAGYMNAPTMGKYHLESRGGRVVQIGALGWGDAWFKIGALGLLGGTLHNASGWFGPKPIKTLWMVSSWFSSGWLESLSERNPLYYSVIALV